MNNFESDPIYKSLDGRKKKYVSLMLTTDDTAIECCSKSFGVHKKKDGKYPNSMSVRAAAWNNTDKISNIFFKYMPAGKRNLFMTNLKKRKTESEENKKIVRKKTTKVETVSGTAEKLFKQKIDNDIDKIIVETSIGDFLEEDGTFVTDLSKISKNKMKAVKKIKIIQSEDYIHYEIELFDKSASIDRIKNYLK